MFPILPRPPSLQFYVSIVTSFPLIILRGSQSKSTPRSSSIPVSCTPRSPPHPANARPLPGYNSSCRKFNLRALLKLRVHPFTLTRQYSDHARPLCRRVVALLDQIMPDRLHIKALASATPLPSLLATDNLLSMQHYVCKAAHCSRGAGSKTIGECSHSQQISICALLTC